MKKDIQTTNTSTDNQTKSSKWRNLLTASLALALGAALLAPLMSGPASASLDDGAFCIRAVSAAGEFEGMKGNCGVVAPVVTPGPVEPSPEPGTVFIRQAVSVGAFEKVPAFANQAWKVTAHLVDGRILEHSGTAKADGTFKASVIFDYDITKIHEPQDLAITLSIAGGTYDTSIPSASWYTSGSSFTTHPGHCSADAGGWIPGCSTGLILVDRAYFTKAASYSPSGWEFA